MIDVRDYLSGNVRLDPEPRSKPKMKKDTRIIPDKKQRFNELVRDKPSTKVVRQYFSDWINENQVKNRQAMYNDIFDG